MFENYFDTLKKYFWFSRVELNSFILTSFGFAFIYSFDKWGSTSFDVSVGLINFLLALLLCSSALFVHHAGQRFMALRLGILAEQKLWWPGLLIAFILVIVSGGMIKMFAASAVFVSLLPQHRLGKFRYGVGMSDWAKIALSGPVFNVFLATIAVFLEWMGVLSLAVSNSIFMFNLYFAAWNLLPFPPLDGSRIIYHSRLAYVFLVSTILAYIGLIWLFDWYSYFSAILIGIICWIWFYLKFESD